MDDTDSILRTLFTGGGIVAIGLVTEIMISFFGKLIIARLFGPVSYGGISLGITMMGMVSTFTILGLNSGIGRYLPRASTPSERRSILISGYVPAISTSLIIGVALAVLSPYVAQYIFQDPDLSDVLFVFAVTIPFTVMVKMAVGSMQGAKQSIPKVFIQNITLPLVRILGIIITIIIGGGILGIAWSYTLSYVIAGLVGIYFVASRTPLFSKDIVYNTKYRELLLFSLPLVTASVMALVFADIDMVMLGMYQTTAAVGVYNVVYPIAELLLISISAFGFLFMPVLSGLHKQKRETEIQKMYKIVTKWMSLITFPLFITFVLFPVPIIANTFGDEYTGGATALVVLAVGFYSHVLAGLNGSALTSVGQTRHIMYANSGTAITNMILNILLIPRWGVLGAAVATGISYIVLNILLSYQLYKLYGIHPFSQAIITPITLGVALAGTCYLIVQFGTITPFISFLIFLILFGITYPPLVLRSGGIEHEEVMLLLSFEERFGLNLGPVKEIAKKLIG